MRRTSPTRRGSVPYHLGTWAYVYTIGYRADLMKDMKFESWDDLWKPELKGKLAAPDFDPSHIIAVAAILSGGDAAHWEKGEDEAQGAEAELQGVLHQRRQQPATARQRRNAGADRAVDERLLHDRAGRSDHFGRFRKKARVLGIDTVGDHEGLEEGRSGLQVHQCALRSRRSRPKSPSSRRAARRCSMPSSILRSPSFPASSRRPSNGRQQINIDAKLRAEKTAEWRKWFAENIMN